MTANVGNVANALERALEELEAVAKELGALDAGTLNVVKLARDRMAELHELQQLATAFAGEHDQHLLSTGCPACRAERRIRALAKTFTRAEAPRT